MDAKTRVTYVTQHIDGIAQNIDATQAEAVAALETIEAAAQQAIKGIASIRDAEIEKRRAFAAAKEARRNG